MLSGKQFNLLVQPINYLKDRKLIQMFAVVFQYHLQFIGNNHT